MTKAEFDLRTLTAHGDAEIYVLLRTRRQVAIEDLTVVGPRVVVLRPVRALIEPPPP